MTIQRVCAWEWVCNWAWVYIGKLYCWPVGFLERIERIEKYLVFADENVRFFDCNLGRGCPEASWTDNVSSKTIESISEPARLESFDFSSFVSRSTDLTGGCHWTGERSREDISWSWIRSIQSESSASDGSGRLSWYVILKVVGVGSGINAAGEIRLPFNLTSDWISLRSLISKVFKVERGSHGLCKPSKEICRWFKRKVNSRRPSRCELASKKSMELAWLTDDELGKRTRRWRGEEGVWWFFGKWTVLTPLRLQVDCYNSKRNWIL